MKSNDKITNLASIQIFELLVIMEQINKGYAIADYKYRLIMLEVYRRDKLKLQPITPGWIQENLHVSAPKASKLVNKLIKLAYIIKKKDQIDRRITRLIGTPTAMVRFESYLATLLLAMHNSDILKLDDEEKESFSALIFKEADSVPILKGLSPEKLKVLNKVWRDVP